MFTITAVTALRQVGQPLLTVSKIDPFIRTLVLCQPLRLFLVSHVRITKMVYSSQEVPRPGPSWAHTLTLQRHDFISKFSLAHIKDSPSVRSFISTTSTNLPFQEKHGALLWFVAQVFGRLPPSMKFPRIDVFQRLHIQYRSPAIAPAELSVETLNKHLVQKNSLIVHIRRTLIVFVAISRSSTYCRSVPSPGRDCHCFNSLAN